MIGVLGFLFFYKNDWGSQFSLVDSKDSFNN